MNEENGDIHELAQAWSIREINALTENIEELVKKNFDLADPEERSPADRVNKKTGGQYWKHLCTLFRLAKDTEAQASNLILADETPLYSPYILLRTAIECTSEGLWLMSTGNDNKKAFYTLKRQHFEGKDFQEFCKTLPNDGASDLVEQFLKVQEVFKAQVPNYKSHSFEKKNKKGEFVGKTPTSKKVMNGDEAFKKKQPRRRYDGFWAWKMCSALTHGNTVLLDAINEQIEVSIEEQERMQLPVDDSSYVARLSPQITLMALILEPAVENLEMFAELLSAQVEAPRTSTDR
jgi:hypothetical protein